MADKKVVHYHTLEYAVSAICAEALAEVLGKPVGEISAPSGTLPYTHFIRSVDVGTLPVGAKLYAVLDSVEADIKAKRQIIKELRDLLDTELIAYDKSFYKKRKQLLWDADCILNGEGGAR